MRKSRFLLLVLIFACSQFCCIAVETPPLENSSLLLPVNHLNGQGERISLKITTPKGYKPLQNPMDLGSKSNILELIPKNDTDPYKWSEIITINLIRGKGITAEQMVESLAQGIKSQALELKVLSTDHKDMGLYQVATTLIRYKTQQREEILFAKYVSGPADLSGIQYALPIDAQQTEAEARKKIDALFDKQKVVEIIKN